MISGVCILLLIILQGKYSKINNILKMAVPISIMIILFNTLFTNYGTTRIYIIGNYFITLEAFIYGIIMACTLLLVTLTFIAYNNYVSYQDMLYVFSKKYPNLSMVIIMALRFVPLIKSRYSELSELNNLKNRNGNLSYIEKLSEIIHTFGLVIAWSLEEAVQTASSMKARGYNTSKRTSYLYYDINLIDILLSIIIISCAIISIIGYFNGFGHINVYPSFNFNFNQISLNIYFLAYIILLLPFIIIELEERILWLS